MYYAKWNYEKQKLDQTPLSIKIDDSWLPVKVIEGQGKDVIYELSEDGGSILQKFISVTSTINFSDYNREIRNTLLLQSDWTQLPDAPVSEEEKIKWSMYRTNLRNAPETLDFVNKKFTESSLKRACKNGI